MTVALVFGEEEFLRIVFLTGAASTGRCLSSGTDREPPISLLTLICREHLLFFTDCDLWGASLSLLTLICGQHRFPY